MENDNTSQQSNVKGKLNHVSSSDVTSSSQEYITSLIRDHVAVSNALQRGDGRSMMPLLQRRRAA